MDEIWNNKRYRTLFLAFSVVFLCFLLGLRYWILPHFNPSLSRKPTEFGVEFIGELTTSFIVSVLLGSFLFYVTPKIMRVAKIEPVEPKGISQLLREAALKSSFWMFKGGMGRYTRAETLPTLAKQGRNSGLMRKLTLMLIDPDNETACQSYALYRSGLLSAKKADELTKVTVRDQILATIVAAARTGINEAMLEIEVVLLSSWSVLRIDVAEEYAVVTSEDYREPGLRVDRDTHFYRTYTKELTWVSKQGRCLPKLNTALGVVLSSPAHVPILLERVGLQFGDLGDARCERIWKLSVESSHQYD